MPFTGVYCADEKYRRNKDKVPITKENCLDCAGTRENNCPWTKELLASVFAEQQNREDRISTTLLTTKCLRSEFLSRRLDWYAEPERLWAAFRGTMYHWQLERVAEGAAIAEARYHATISGLGELSGSPDLVDIQYGKLYDYKTNRENPRFNYPWAEHGQQVNINRWLVDNAHTVEWQDETYNMADPEVAAKFRPVEWTGLYLIYMDDKGPKTLEVTRSEQVPKADGKGTKNARVSDIWSDEQAEAWIRKKYAYIQSVFANNEVPAITEEFQGWEHPLCGFCDNKPVCIDLAYGGEVPVAITTKREAA